jgi:hypothetical protein
LVLAAAHLVIHSVKATKAPNMPIAVQLVACLSAWPRSAPAAMATDAAQAKPAAMKKFLGVI